MSSSEELPCLFCFSISSASQGYHYHQGDKARIERVYRFMCDVLGVKLNPDEDYFSVFDEQNEQEGQTDSFFPLCVHCCLLFQNLCELQDQLFVIQEKINAVALEIRSKVHESEENSPALAIAIQSLGQTYSASQATSNKLTWMQRFRHRVNQKGADNYFQNQHHHNHQLQYVIVPADHLRPIQLTQDGFSNVAGAPMTLYVSDEVITSDVDPRNEDDDEHENDFYEDNNDDPNWRESEYPQTIKRTPQKRRRRVPPKSGTKPKRARRTSKSPSKIKRIPKKPSPNKTPKVPDELKKFRCHVCSKGFNVIYQLKVHLPTHTGQKNYSCDICNEKFISRNAVARHNQAVHGTKLPFCCPICKLRRSTNSSLQWHMKTHDYNLPNKPPFTCPECNNGKEFQNKMILRRHVYAHFNLDKFQCTFCTSKFSRREDLMSHMTRKHRNQIPEEGKKFQCIKCPLEFDDSNQLITHMWSHGRQKAPSCQICRIAFQTIADRDVHCEQLHGKQVTRFPCPSCDLVFTSRAQLKHHTKLHNSVERTRMDVLCTQCNKTYFDQATLKKHIRLVHENHGRPFLCSHEGCGKTYKRNEDLNKHLKSHLNDAEKLRKTDEMAGDSSYNDQKLTCDQCNLTFKSNQNFKRHKLTIHAEKQFECDVCSKFFRRKDELMKHTRNMHGIDHWTRNVIKAGTSHVCEICGKVFGTKGGLRKHVKIFHESKDADDDGVVHEHPQSQEIQIGKGFTCKTCGTFYKSMRNLRKHEREIHGAAVRKQKIQVVHEGGEVVTQEVHEEDETTTSSIEVAEDKDSNEDGEEEIILKNDPKKAICKLCDKSFFSNSTLRRHIKIQHGHQKTERPYRCEMCEKTYKRTDDLRKHERVVHGKLIPSSRKSQPQSESKSQPNTSVCACPYCNTEWTNENRLKLHIASHTGVKEHIKPRAANGQKKKVGSFFKIVVTNLDGSEQTVDTSLENKNESESDVNCDEIITPSNSNKVTKKCEETRSRMNTRSSSKRAKISIGKEKHEDSSSDDDEDMEPETSKKSTKREVISARKSKRTIKSSNRDGDTSESDFEYYPIVSDSEQESDVQ